MGDGARARATSATRPAGIFGIFGGCAVSKEREFCANGDVGEKGGREEAGTAAAAAQAAGGAERHAARAAATATEEANREVDSAGAVGNGCVGAAHEEEEEVTLKGAKVKRARMCAFFLRG